MIVVSNSTPLIALASINSLNLIEKLYGKIYIPEAVYQEIVIAGAGRVGASEVDAASWIIKQSVKDQSGVAQLETRTGLAKGESEAIILTQELSAGLILLDDRAARRVAVEKNLSRLGTIGVLLSAKQSNLILVIKPLLDALLNANIYLDSALYEKALLLADE